MKIELSTDQKIAIDKMKQLYKIYWKIELKSSWQTGIWKSAKNGLNPREIKALEELHNTIMNKGLEQIQ